MPLTPPTLSPPAVSSYHHLLTTFPSHPFSFEFLCHPPCHPFFLYSFCLPVPLPLFFVLLNLTISLPPSLRSQAKYCKPPLQLHLLSVRNKGEGHARRSWHQPVTLPSLLPPSASLLNQITPLTHAHKSAFLNQPSSSALLNLAPFALFICQLSTDCVQKDIYSRSPIGKKETCVYLHAFLVSG